MYLYTSISIAMIYVHRYIDRYIDTHPSAAPPPLGRGYPPAQRSPAREYDDSYTPFRSQLYIEMHRYIHIWMYR